LLRKRLSYLLLFCAAVARGQFNYGHQMDFGKNRIQYQNFVWTYFDYERFRVYSYQGGNEISKYVSVSVNRQLPMLEKRLDYPAEDKINILVYNNQGDFKQSNLGLSSEEQSNIGGFTRIIGDKVSVFYNGSHAELDQQIRAALASLLINKMLYGGNAREMVRNSTLLNVPEWYSEGLVKYLSEGWTAYHDNIMYDQLRNSSFNSFNRLTGKQAAQAGHALWYFIVSTYGESMIANLLYMTRVTRSPENAFITTLGVTLTNLVYDFTESYQRRLYNYRDTLRTSPIHDNSVLKSYRANRHYYQPRVSPDGKKVVYARNELNQLRVYMMDTESGKQQRLLKYGPKVEQIEDHNYPLLAWHPTGQLVAMVYERKDQLILHTYDVESGEHVRRNLPSFEQVNSISYSNDGKRLAISAVRKGKGQNDIYVFGLNTGAVEQLTNDIWDDNNPVFAKGSTQIVFESNRPGDTIRANEDALYFASIQRNNDLFMAPYPFKSKVLVRIANTPDVNETLPQAYGNDFVAYLSDRNGIYNRYLARYDSAIAFVDTTEHYRYYFNTKPVSNYDRNILDQHINPKGTHVAELIYANGKDMMLLSPLEKLDEVKLKDPHNTWHRSFIGPAINDPGNYKEVRSDNLSPQRGVESGRGIDFENYRFENEQEKKAEVPVAAQTGARTDTAKKAGPEPFRFPIQRNYYTSFYTDYVVTQFDNSFLANNYQVFAGGGTPIYLNPGFNFLTKVAISDLFEDERIVGGFRINPNLDNEFMLSWEKRRRLWDHQLVLDRQTFQSVPSFDNNLSYFARVNTHTAKYSIKYPLNPVNALRFSVLFRNDRKVALSAGDFSLPKKPVFENLGGVRVEYIFDNTRHIMLNIMNGMRFKLWSEYWMFYGGEGRDLFTSGFDVRHYQRVHRQITWCNRFAGGNSLGSDRLIFYLGGVDNWLNPSFNNNVNIVKPEQYGFQTLATNMRGFQQNIRNGNNFMVFNSELRVPLIRYLLDHPVRSDFLNNFQVVGFGDLGMAWYGFNPLSEDNTQNVKVFVQNDPALGRGGTGIIVTVIDDKNPLVGGFGFGLRSRILGYFVRLDFGWGVDNWQVQKRIVGLSLTTDF
jgi:Tol biopolymer transport system component